MARWDDEATLWHRGLGMPAEGPSAARFQVAREAMDAVQALDGVPGGVMFARGILGVARGEVPAVAQVVGGARQLAASLVEAGAHRDAATLVLTARLLTDLSEPTRNIPELRDITRRWEADPTGTAETLDSAMVPLPGGWVVARDESVRFLGDTDYYIYFEDRPSGTEIFNLYDFPLEGIAVSLDGRRVYAQRHEWGKRERIRRRETYRLLTGEHLGGDPQPAAPDEVVMLADLFEAAGQNPRSPDGTRIDFGPPGVEPWFRFGASAPE